MSWYDRFAVFYDLMLEWHYRGQRETVADALELQEGMRVLDVPCGTGQSWPGLVRRVGAGGRVVGVDLSAGMVAAAQRRAARQGWAGAVGLVKDGGALTLGEVTDLAGGPIDRLHIFLGMSVFPEPDRLFGHLWDLLAPGGRCVIADVHDPNPGLQGRFVCWMAQADIRRRSWEPLERRAQAFELRPLANRWADGGPMFLAVGDKPR
jgi:ubiquinone/menaquinone biosynthesis C-methylase UbiE